MRFAIFGHARSGTTTLQEVLNYHPNLRVISEPFNIDRASWGKDYRIFIKENSIDTAIKHLRTDCDGFKHLLGQLTLEQTEQLLKALQKVIWIERKNLLQASVSNQISIQAKHWRRDRKQIENCIFQAVPVDNVMKFITNLQELIPKTKNLLKELNIPVYETVYEDLYSSQRPLDEKFEVIQNIFRFLGLPVITNKIYKNKIKELLNPEFSKLNNFETYKLIPNIDELASLGNKEIGYLFTEI